MLNHIKINEFHKSDFHISDYTGRCLFLLIILIEAGIFSYLIYGHRIIGGHDGFLYFSLQYSFLNNVVNYGEIPQWCPFLTHGFLATMGYTTQAGILQNILFLSEGLFKNVNFLPLFYAGIFIDELLLLIGTWLLARRFFTSPFTVFFVTLSIMGSCIWMLQPWWNFHLYYAIPLILYFIHAFIDSGNWRYCFLAGNLLFMQCLGNIPYFLPLTSLVIFLYFLFYLIINYRDVLPKMKNNHWGWSFVMTISLIIASFSLLYIALNLGTHQMIYNNYDLRNPDGSTTLDVFLSYGGKISWRAWLELFLGISPFIDYTLYIGILCVPFILMGFILNVNRRSIPFILTIIILLLFSMGTFVSVFFYYSWPMMKYFRYLLVISPIIKVFLCFMAGFGFDAVFFDKSRWNNNLLMKASLAVFSLSMLGLSLFLFILSNNYEHSIKLIESMGPETLPSILFNKGLLIFLLHRTAFFTLIYFILFAVLFLTHKHKYLIALIIIFITLHCMDIYGFKLTETRLKTTPLSDKLYNITSFQQMPYPYRRDVSFWNKNPRGELLKVLPIQHGTFYWIIDYFLFKDEWKSQFSYCLLTFYNYMKAYSSANISHKSYEIYKNAKDDNLKGHPAAYKISGVTEDKIQFFSSACFTPSETRIASLIADIYYKGDTIFLSASNKDDKIIGINSVKSSFNDLYSNKRLHLSYQVQHFDSNSLEISTNTDDLKSAWLFYSDVWHPLWRATVNGKEVPVYKANLAYKAVKLDQGFNKVHFFFKSRLVSVVYFMFSLNALCWLGIIIFLTGKIAFNNKNY